ncbi:MAG: tandem-95 repeat protein [Deltaproteobacteria bacterium]|nr:tandem-95 repeat protein [Deltaproteobacteria bacterium]
MMTSACLLSMIASASAVGAAPVGTPPKGSPPKGNAPIVEPAAYTVDEDTVLRETVKAADADGDRLYYVVGAPPKRGTLTIDRATGAFAYTPLKNVHGEDTFKVWVSDGKLIGSAVMTVTVASVDDPPELVGAAPTLRVFEDGKAGTRMQAVDADKEPLSLRIVADPEHGTATVDSTGTISYSPARDYDGEDAFSVEVAAGGATVTGDVRVTIVPVNDAPAATAAAVSGAEDQQITGTVGGSDVDGDALSYRVGAQPKRGSLVLDEKSGAFSYTPWKDVHGSDAFTFAASDGKLFGTATVSLTVAPVDDPPALLGAAPVLRVLEDGCG